MKVFTVEAPLESPEKEKKAGIATSQLAMMPAFKVVEKKKNGSSTLVKAVLFVVFAFLLAAVLTVVISEYAWKRREGGQFFRMRWEDVRSKFQGEPIFDRPSIPVQIDDPKPSPEPAVETIQVVQQPDDSKTKQSALADLAKLDLLRALVDRIRNRNQQQSMMMGDGVDSIAMISVEPFEGRRPIQNSREQPTSAEADTNVREPMIIDDLMNIPIQIHPPMTPSNRHGGQRHFGPWPSDDYYTASFYPDYQYPDFPVESFGPFAGHNGPRHNGPPMPFDPREFNGPPPPDHQFPDFSPEHFAAGPPPPPFGRRGPHNNRPFGPDYSDDSFGPFNGPPPHGPPHGFNDGPNGMNDGPPPFGPFGPNGPQDGPFGPNGPQNGPFGGPPPPHFGPFGGPDGPHGGPRGFGKRPDSSEEQSDAQQPTVRITQHFDKNSEQPSAIVTEIFGGKKMERMIASMIASSVMPNQIEQNGGDQLPPWMKPQFGPNANPPMIQGGNMQNNPIEPQSNPFFATPNQIQSFNLFPAMNEIQSRPAMMNQFNPTPINQQPFDMNLNQVQQPQIAPFFHDVNQMRQEASQFRPEMPTVFANNNQNDLFPGHIFPENQQNQHQQAVQPEIGQGAVMMFPPVQMPNPNQVQMETPLFEPASSANAAGPQPHGSIESGIADNLDPRIPQPLAAPRAVDNNWSPEVQHWNQEMLQQNQHHFQGMTPEVFAASLNITPDMAPQQPPTEQQQQHHQPPMHPQFHADFNDQGMVFSPPMPPTDAHVIAGNAPALTHNSEAQVDVPQAHGPPALVPQAPAPAPAPTQDIPSVWDHPLNQQQHEDPPVASRSEGFGKAK